MPSLDADTAKTGMSGRSQEEPVACTPVVSGALAQLFALTRDLLIAGLVVPELVHVAAQPAGTGGDALPAGVAGALTACADRPR